MVGEITDGAMIEVSNNELIVLLLKTALSRVTDDARVFLLLDNALVNVNDGMKICSLLDAALDDMIGAPEVGLPLAIVLKDIPDRGSIVLIPDFTLADVVYDLEAF